MTVMRRHRLLGLVLLALPWTPGGTQEAPIPSPIIEREEVHFVTLDLIVEKRVRGGWRGVPGIRPEELLVKVGGVPVELDEFEDQCPREGRARRAAAPDREPIRYVLYFDLVHLKLAGFRQSFDAALRWAATSVRPHDLVMIITGGNGLRIVRPLLPASEGLREDLLAAREDYDGTLSWAEMEGDSDRGRIREILDRIQPAETRVNLPAGQELEPARHLANAYASMDFSRARRSVETLETLMSLFQAIDGTKNLVVFQETLRLKPGAIYPYADRITDIQVFLKRLALAANQRNVRFYPVAAGGLATTGTHQAVAGGLAQQGSVLSGPLSRAGGPSGPQASDDPFQHLADDAMSMLAAATGGQVAEGGNDLAIAFERVEEDASCQYRLGFRLPARYDGRAKGIWIQVGEGRKYRLRYRRSLRDSTREQLETERLQAAFLDPDSSRDFPVSAVAAPLFDHRRGGRVGLQVRMDVAELLAVRTESAQREARVKVGGIVLPRLPLGERKGRGVMAEIDPHRQSWDFSSGGILKIEDGSLDGRELVLTREINAPPGDYWLVAVVEDALAGTVGTAVAAFQVPEEPEPLKEVHLVVQAADALFLKDPTDGEREPDGRHVRPAIPMLPAGGLVLETGELQAGSPLTLALGVCRPRGATRAEERELRRPGSWSLDRTLTCEGRDVPAALTSRLHPAPGEDELCYLFLDELPPGVLEPGRCSYRVTLEQPRNPPVVRELRFQVVGESATTSPTGPVDPRRLAGVPE